MIIQVKQGYEPLNFTGHFQAWDRDKWSVSMLIYIITVLKPGCSITQLRRLSEDRLGLDPLTNIDYEGSERAGMGFRQFSQG